MFLLSAQLNEARSQRALGIYYYQGYGCIKDEVKGLYAGEDVKVHEVWTTKNNELVIDYAQTTYEGDSDAIHSVRTFYRMTFSGGVSEYIAEDGGAQYQYGIDPLTVYYTYIAEDENTYGLSATYEVSFDEYGNLAKGSFEQKQAGIAQKGKLEVKLTYENK